MKHLSKISKPILGVGVILLLVFAFAGQAAAQTCVQPPSGMISWWDGDSVTGTTAEDILG